MAQVRRARTVAAQNCRLQREILNQDEATVVATFQEIKPDNKAKHARPKSPYIINIYRLRLL